MIGEIRDTETAEIAVQASITGHLVVSTLHTNSAAASVTRLTDMGIESYLLADSLVGIIAQRLVRKLCPKCKAAHEATEEEKRLLGADPLTPLTVYEPVGCPYCSDTGYYGRTGVYEIVEITPKLKRLISKQASTTEIQAAAIEEGTNTLHMAAAQYVLEGITSISEMLRITFDFDE